MLPKTARSRYRPRVERGHTDVLVLAAHAVELEGLEHVATLGESRSIGKLRVAADVVGVGLTAAGAGTARSLALHAPRAVVLVGSFGRYPGRIGYVPCEVCVASRVRLVSATVILGEAAFPSPMPVALELDRGLCVALERHGAKRMDALGTTLAITTDDALARMLGERSGCEGENLEAVAVAHACAQAKVPCAMLVGCTNAVGSRGRAEWLANHGPAARAVGVTLHAWLSALGG